MTGIAGKAGSVRSVKAPTPLRTLGGADVREVSTPCASHSHSAVAPSLPPEGNAEQNHAQRRHEHPAPHTYIIAQNEGTGAA